MMSEPWREAEDAPTVHDGEEQIFEVWYESAELLTHLTYQGGLGWCGKNPDNWRYSSPPER